MLVGVPHVLVQGSGDGGRGQEGSWCGVDLGDFQSETWNSSHFNSVIHATTWSFSLCIKFKRV